LSIPAEKTLEPGRCTPAAAILNIVSRKWRT
jgi:hypothetical protein